MSLTTNSPTSCSNKMTRRRDALFAWLLAHAGRLYTIGEMREAGFTWPEDLDFYDRGDNQTRDHLQELHRLGLLKRGRRVKEQKRPFRLALGSKDLNSLSTCIKKVYCWGVMPDETI